MRVSCSPLGLTNQEKVIHFFFNGKRYLALEGDTLASALVANEVNSFARSFKYGRKRGVMAADVSEANALVGIESGGYYQPNLKASEVLLYDGLVAKSAGGGKRFDLRAFLRPLHRFIGAGFYYKTFIKQGVWSWTEGSLRSLSGFCEAPTEIDAEAYQHEYHHPDFLVVGGGIAGINFVLEVLNNTKEERVILVDERVALGGESVIDALNDQALRQHIEEKLAMLSEWSSSERLTIFNSTTAFAYHDSSQILAYERSGDPATPRARKHNLAGVVHKIYAKHTVLATGAHERAMLFGNNDLANIMLAQSVERFASQYGAIGGRNILIYGDNDSIYEVANTLSQHEVALTVVDVRPRAKSPFLASLKRKDVFILQGYAVRRAHGGGQVKGVSISSCRWQDGAWQVGEDTQKLACDLVGVSGGFSPVVHLYCHRGQKVRFDETLNCFLPNVGDGDIICCGSLAGYFKWEDASQDASNKARQAVGVDAGEVVNECMQSPIFAPKSIVKDKKVFIDLQNDVTTQDIELALAEGYSSIELVKRYTAAGFGTDQGKSGNINVVATVASLLSVSLASIGVTTFRPPYTAVPFGALAGAAGADLYDAKRLTAIHASHVERGAEIELVGQWLRPWYFPEAGETMDEALLREGLAARKRLAMMDASTLGKIDVRGRDAKEFLSRVYTNSLTTLKPGGCRYGLMCDEKGMIIDDGICICVSEDHFYLTTTTGGAANVFATLELWLQTEWQDLEVVLTSLTDSISTVAVVGPHARLLMQDICKDIDFSQEKFAFMQWRDGHVSGVPARVMRVSFSGELAYEINVEGGYGRYLWDTVAEAGKTWGITPYGTEMMHILRAEKGYIIVGQDTDGTMTPMDMNMGWAVGRKKTFSFIGKRSLDLFSLNASGRLQFVGLYTDDNQIVIPEGAHAVDDKRRSIGYVTSSYFSPILNRSIALAMIRDGHAKMGEAVTIALVQPRLEAKDISCTITSPIFYDPEGKVNNGIE